MCSCMVGLGVTCVCVCEFVSVCVRDNVIGSVSACRSIYDEVHMNNYTGT